jgi:hypothetical protein
MASQFVLFEQIKWIGATLPALVRLAALLGQSTQPFCPVTFLEEAVTRALEFLPTVVAAVSPALIELVSDPYCIAICLVRFVSSCWSLLHLLTQFV